MMDRKKDAVEMYNEGIQRFPNTGLLYYNKAITFYSAGKVKEAIEAIKPSISLNPYHGSSHNFLAVVTAKQNKVQSLMSSLVLLAIEPGSKRAKDHLQMVETALNSAKKTGDSSVAINLEMPANNKKEGEDFRPIELFIGLNSGLDYSEKYKNETKHERLYRKLEGLCSMLKDTRGQKSPNDIGWTFYAPFFAKLKDAGQLEAFSHIIYSTSDDEVNSKWLVDNTEKVESFNKWFRKFWKNG